MGFLAGAFCTFYYTPGRMTKETGLDSPSCVGDWHGQDWTQSLLLKAWKKEEKKKGGGGEIEEERKKSIYM